MSDGQVLKAEKDFTKEVDKLLPEAQELAKVCISPSRLAIIY
jgi:26S proteasome regulatory subunit N5